MSLNFLVNKEQAAHESDIFSIVSRGSSIFTTSSDGTVKEWDLHTQDHASTINGVFHMGGHELSVGADEMGVLVGAGFAGDLQLITSSGATSIGSGPTPSLATSVSAVSSPSPSTSPAVAGSVSKQKDPIPWSLAISPDSSTLATTSSSGTLQVYNVTTSSGNSNDSSNNSTKLSTPTSIERVAEIETRGHFGMCIAYAPDNRSISTGHTSGGLFLFDTALGTLRHVLGGHLQTVRCVRYSPASRLLASAGDDKRIVVHDVATGEQIASIPGHATAITTLDWNATGEFIVSASLDGKVKLWNFETRECVGTFTESLGKRVWSVKWCKMGNSKLEGFVTGGSEGVLKFYLPTSQN